MHPTMQVMTVKDQDAVMPSFLQRGASHHAPIIAGSWYSHTHPSFWMPPSPQCVSNPGRGSMEGLEASNAVGSQPNSLHTSARSQTPSTHFGLLQFLVASVGTVKVHCSMFATGSVQALMWLSWSSRVSNMHVVPARLLPTMLRRTNDAHWGAEQALPERIGPVTSPTVSKGVVLFCVRVG